MPSVSMGRATRPFVFHDDVAEAVFTDGANRSVGLYELLQTGFVNETITTPTCARPRRWRRVGAHEAFFHFFLFFKKKKTDDHPPSVPLLLFFSQNSPPLGKNKKNDHRTAQRTSGVRPRAHGARQAAPVTRSAACDVHDPPSRGGAMCSLLHSSKLVEANTFSTLFPGCTGVRSSFRPFSTGSSTR